MERSLTLTLFACHNQLTHVKMIVKNQEINSRYENFILISYFICKILKINDKIIKHDMVLYHYAKIFHLKIY